MATTLLAGALILGACRQQDAATTPARPTLAIGSATPTTRSTASPSPERSPISTRPGRSTPQASVPVSPRAVRAPEAPCGPNGLGDGLPRLASQVRSSTIVAIVRVVEIRPARWTTPDGRRPTGTPSGYWIITPVLAEVEQYLKGDRPERQLLLAVRGGVVDGDCAAPHRVDAWYPRDDYDLGGRLVVFLHPPQGPLPMLNGEPLWSEVFRYAIDPEGLVTVPRDDLFAPRTIPLQQLLDEIATAQQRP